MVGPSLGYFYGGISGKGWNGILLRTGFVALAVAGLSIGWNSENGNAGLLLAVVGAAGMYISAINDIVTVSSRVEKHNVTLKLQIPRTGGFRKSRGSEIRSKEVLVMGKNTTGLMESDIR